MSRPECMCYKSCRTFKLPESFQSEAPHHPLCIVFISSSHVFFGRNVLSSTGMHTFWKNGPMNSSRQHLLCVSSPNPAGNHSVVPVNYSGCDFLPCFVAPAAGHKADRTEKQKNMAVFCPSYVFAHWHTYDTLICPTKRCTPAHTLWVQVCLLSGWNVLG